LWKKVTGNGHFSSNTGLKYRKNVFRTFFKGENFLIILVDNIPFSNAVNSLILLPTAIRNTRDTAKVFIPLSKSYQHFQTGEQLPQRKQAKGTDAL